MKCTLLVMLIIPAVAYGQQAKPLQAPPPPVKAARPPQAPDRPTATAAKPPQAPEPPVKFITYEEAFNKARTKGLPIAVFVDCEPRDVPGFICCKSIKLIDWWKSNEVVVGIWIEDEFFGAVAADKTDAGLKAAKEHVEKDSKVKIKSLPPSSKPAPFYNKPVVNSGG